MPAVERLVAGSKVQVEAAYGRYRAAHDALVVGAAARCAGQPQPCRLTAGWAQLLHPPAAPHLTASPPPPAHCHPQADPRYSAAVAKGGELLASLQASPAYKAAVTRITPLLELPAAQSAAKLAAPYVTAVTSHLAPVAA